MSRSERWTDGRWGTVGAGGAGVGHADLRGAELLAYAHAADHLFRKDGAQFGIGDSVRVHTKVVEGDKERIQIFSGVVIGRRGHGLNEMFTVRRISYGEGVERVFPVHSPRVDKIEVERKGRTRRAKLTYLRRRLGKGATLVKEKEAKAASPAAQQ